ncbi:MAG: hypothetical protein AAF236_16925 [Verrucomicrobiota bacterium]
MIPEHDVVIAITAKTKQMQDQLDLIWEKLLPAFQVDPLPADPAAVETLKQVAAKLTTETED